MAKVLKQVKKQKKRENMGNQHCVFEEKQVPFSYVLIHYQVTKFMGIGGQHEIAVKMMWNVHELVLFYRFDSIKQKIIPPMFIGCLRRNTTILLKIIKIRLFTLMIFPLFSVVDLPIRQQIV